MNVAKPAKISMNCERYPSSQKMKHFNEIITSKTLDAGWQCKT